MTGSVQGARVDGEILRETFKNSLRELGPFCGGWAVKRVEPQASDIVRCNGLDFG